MLGRGSRGLMVKALQGIMAETGAYEGAIDGWFGPRTEAAVKEWQSFIGAPRTGYWDPDTMRASAGVMTALNGPDAGTTGATPVVPRGH